MPTTPPPRCRARRTLPLLLLVVLLVGGLAGGCGRVRTALALQPDDTVTGEVVLATPQKSPDDRGPTVTLPPDLASDVVIAAYRQEGYTGSVLTFSGLTFDQVGALTSAISAPNGAVTLALRRSGGRVLVSGKANLTSATADKADFQLKISFPGKVVETNGESDAGTVSWTFAAGKAAEVTAVLAYADPKAPSVLNWTLGLAGVVLLAAAVVALLARRTRNPPLTPLIR